MFMSMCVCVTVQYVCWSLYNKAGCVPAPMQGETDLGNRILIPANQSLSNCWLWREFTGSRSEKFNSNNKGYHVSGVYIQALH